MATKINNLKLTTALASYSLLLFAALQPKKAFRFKMATNNSNQPSSSAAFAANEEKQVKGLIGPGELDQNAKGEDVCVVV